ncbi:hypothetical protein [Variovorax sp. OV700]|uniref:hypothetical protein n=1 Tax=Variovorax sp. OV700 TaxID=1882826 RepID=UPI0011146CC6|nr:hypothetical protein [Variovorax sp. OV700]
MAGKFYTAEQAALADPDNTSSGAAMLARGFPLIRASCNDYFDSAGKTQRWIIVARDTVGAVGTLATAVLALHNASQMAVSNTAIVTGAAFTGLDLYTKNFLFAAENVDSVRTLVLNALSVHEEAVGQLGSMAYGPSLNALLDNQNICAPMHIAALAREAIQRGVVVARTDLTQGVALVTQRTDDQVQSDLGALLNPPGIVSSEQSGALWWLLKEASSPAERVQNIAPRLAGLPASTDPFDRTNPAAPVLKAAWSQQQAVSRLLDGFSAPTKEGFRSTIAGIRVFVAAPAPAVLPGQPGPVPPDFRLSRIRGASSTGRVSVGIGK